MESERLRTMTEVPPNKEAPLGALRKPITSSGSFFVRSHFAVPSLDIERWKLRVDGEVSTPAEFSYRELRRMPRVQLRATLECAGNGRSLFPRPAENEVAWGTGAVGTASWSGVSLASLLEEVGVGEDATEVVGEGLDAGKAGGRPETISFARALPVAKALAPETIVALEMNGQPLSPEHGYPARLLVPGWYGMASVKWLGRLTVIRGDPFAAFFNGTKYVYEYERDGRRFREPVSSVRVSSMITEPEEGQRLSAGTPVVVQGKAWSGSAKVASVEVDLGEGWEKAELGESLGRFAWTPWSKTWVPRRSGPAVISVRATDAEGNSQPMEPFENKHQYGCNAIRRIVVQVV